VALSEKSETIYDTIHSPHFDRTWKRRSVYISCMFSKPKICLTGAVSRKLNADSILYW